MYLSSEITSNCSSSSSSCCSTGLFFFFLKKNFFIWECDINRSLNFNNNSTTVHNACVCLSLLYSFYLSLVFKCCKMFIIIMLVWISCAAHHHDGFCLTCCPALNGSCEPSLYMGCLAVCLLNCCLNGSIFFFFYLLCFHKYLHFFGLGVEHS